MGETLTLDELPTMPPDSSPAMWSLKFFVDLTTDHLGSRSKEAVIPGSTVSVLLHDDQVDGSAGCNTYQATFEIHDESIAIGPPSATKQVCEDIESPDDVMKQESRFLNLLPQVTRAVTIADRLFLSTPTGIYLIFEST